MRLNTIKPVWQLRKNWKLRTGKQSWNLVKRFTFRELMIFEVKLHPVISTSKRYQPIIFFS